MCDSPTNQPWGNLRSRNLETVDNISLVKYVHVIGRATSCDTVITSNCISNSHCTLRVDCTTSSVTLQDNSTNGTYVNRRRVGRGKEIILSAGDEIKLLISKGKEKFQDIGLVFVPNFQHPLFKAQRERESLGAAVAAAVSAGTADPIPQAHEQLTKKYQIVKKIGSGGYSEVMLAICKSTNAQVALKIIPKKRMGFRRKSEEKLLREADILRKIQHPNIISVLDVIDTPETLYLVLEYAEGGELFAKIKREKRLLEKECKCIFIQLCNAVKYLHDKGIAHRDLKPENILLAHSDNVSEVKLSDFGLARIMEDEYFLMTTMCGTPLYVAPEIVHNATGGYTIAVDLWSLGVNLYVLLCGRPPFKQKVDACGKKLNQLDFNNNVTMIGPVWDMVSENAKDLIKKLLTKDVKSRLDINAVLSHPWIVEPDESESDGEEEESEGGNFANAASHDCLSARSLAACKPTKKNERDEGTQTSPPPVSQQNTGSTNTIPTFCSVEPEPLKKKPKLASD